jgi:hypothetical protein
VAKIKKLTEQRDKQPATRREEYTAPRLKVFGPVGALTQGGSIGMAEGSGPQGMKA